MSHRPFVASCLVCISFGTVFVPQFSVVNPARPGSRTGPGSPPGPSLTVPSLTVPPLAEAPTGRRDLMGTGRYDSRVVRGGEKPSVKPASLSLEDVVTGRATIVDLTYVLNEKTPYWPGPKYHPFELKTLATLDKDGVLSKAFCMPEHLGTHIDAPNHFEANQKSVEQITPTELFAPGVVIDIRRPCEQNADYAVTLKDVKRWERRHGRIPDNAVVLLNTGWSRFWNNYARYKNQDARGRLHFPGYSAKAAEFLVRKRHVNGIGIDTLSIDRGLSRKFDVHHIVNKAGKYGLENVANLNKLPARGFYVVIAPLKIETGSGGPARLFAIMPKASGETP